MDGQDQVQSGAGYGDGGMDNGAEGSIAPARGGGMDSSGGKGGTGEQGSEGQGGGQQADQSVQRSETVEAEDLEAGDIEFDADDDLIDNDDA